MQVNGSNMPIPPALSKSAGDKEIREAAQQFEAIFLNEIFKQMRAAVPKGDLLKESMGEQVFRGMLDQEIAQKAAETGGLGLAEIIFRQLKGK